MCEYHAEAIYVSTKQIRSLLNTSTLLLRNLGRQDTDISIQEVIQMLSEEFCCKPALMLHNRNHHNYYAKHKLPVQWSTKIVFLTPPIKVLVHVMC